MSDSGIISRSRVAIVVLVVASAAGIVLASFFRPSLRPLVGGPLFLLIVSLLWLLHDFQRRARARFRQRFLEGACVQCGYHLLRSGPQATRCSECGSARWTPDQPMKWPSELWPDPPWSVAFVAGEADLLVWMFEQRGLTPIEVWGDDELRRRVAGAVVGACTYFPAGKPVHRCLPSDPFDIVSAFVTIDSFAQAIDEALDVYPAHDLCASFNDMTLEQVVDEVVLLVQRKTVANVDSVEST